MNEYKFMAMGIHTENGTPQQPSVRYFRENERNQAERQYCLYRAAAAISNYEVDTAVLMTIDGFLIESKTYEHEPAAQSTPAENQ